MEPPSADTKHVTLAAPNDEKLLSARTKSDDDENLQTDDDLSVDLDHEAIKSWDEGGASDCGYSIGVHDTIMALGGSVHKVVGDPSQETKSAMGTIGNWFQEMSYAVRDIFRGKTQDMEKDSHGLISQTMSHVNQMMTGKAEDAEETEEKKDDADSTSGPEK